MHRDALLSAYDDQLRGDSETVHALSVARHGPLLFAVLPGSRGFVTHPNPGVVSRSTLQGWVDAAREHFWDAGAVEVEWKTRGHDRIEALDEVLSAAGFVAAEPESIMIGPAALLAVAVPLPSEVTLRVVSTETDVRALCRMQDEIFGSPFDESRVRSLLAAIDGRPDIENWVAEVAGQMVSAGRVQPVPGTDFAGIWGGVTRPDWRGRGIYRALTAARARSAVSAGYTLINSDCTEFSRPILQRAGLSRVSTTTPYLWVP